MFSISPTRQILLMIWMLLSILSPALAGGQTLNIEVVGDSPVLERGQSPSIGPSVDIEMDPPLLWTTNHPPKITDDDSYKVEDLDSYDPARAPHYLKTKAIIYPGVYRSNLKYFVNEFSKQHTGVCAVLKGDAYGHGLRYLAQAAVEAGVKALAIATNEEGECVRSLNIKCRVVRIKSVGPSELRYSLNKKLKIEEIVGSLDQAKAFNMMGKSFNIKIPVHVEIDLGMGRMGLTPKELVDNLEELIALEYIDIVGIMTHFPSTYDHSFDQTIQSMEIFQHLLRDTIFPHPYFQKKRLTVHASNSAAALRYDLKHGNVIKKIWETIQHVGGDDRSKSVVVSDDKNQVDEHSVDYWVRLGSVSYGVLSQVVREKLENALSGIRPVMSVISEVQIIQKREKGSKVGYDTFILERDSTLATISIGSQQGVPYDWHSKVGSVLIKGHQVPIISITGEMMVVDVTDLINNGIDVSMGNQVVLVGKMKREGKLPNEEEHTTTRSKLVTRTAEEASLGKIDPSILLGSMGKQLDKQIVDSSDKNKKKK